MEAALAEIAELKPHWVTRLGWAPAVNRTDSHVDLFIRFMRRRDPEDVYVLRLRYTAGFDTAGRREVFVCPDDLEKEGVEYWPEGVRPLKLHRGNSKPPMICLEGTWGFHSNLHRDRDGRVARLNHLLMELQGCMDE